jgi:hypothetical protein
MTVDAMLAIKLVVFVFIVTSPFYDGAKVFAFAKNDLVKFLLLLVVIGLAFVDLQLAILAAIAFFIILIYTLPTVVTAKELPPPKPLYTAPLLAPASVIYQEPEEEEDKPDFIEVIQRDVPQTMYDFPDTRCSVPVEANDAYVNESINNHYLDEKIKPYEQYISQLTNEEFLESVSNAAYLQPAAAP